MTVGELIEQLSAAPDRAMVRIDVSIGTDCSGYLHLTGVRFGLGPDGPIALLDVE